MRRNVEVKIPDGLKGGDKFNVKVALNKQIQVEVPPGYRGGQKLQLSVEMQSREELQQIQKALSEAGKGSVLIVLFGWPMSSASFGDRVCLTDSRFFILLLEPLPTK